MRLGYSLRNDGPAYGVFDGCSFQVGPIVYIDRPTGIQDSEPSKYRVGHMEEKFSGKKFEDIAPQGENRVKEWMKVQPGFTKVESWYAKKGEEYLWI